MIRRTIAEAAVAGAALAVVAAAPADAALYSHDRFDLTFTETFDECGITIDHTAVAHGGFSIRTIKGTNEAYLGWQPPVRRGHVLQPGHRALVHDQHQQHLP